MDSGDPYHCERLELDRCFQDKEQHLLFFQRA
ncbi:hypothetical protein T11_7075 [Trichinella zimbabwensis]|uniref:Uncharacterized protein n=1 Tax=Trichinella zimbabwensis TaxID=268475 RepID=A0A0V1G9X3_9BILA|nr:hypothetical protein T11_7075 [Trichinella zimbabwensis]